MEAKTPSAPCDDINLELGFGFNFGKQSLGEHKFSHYGGRKFGPSPKTCLDLSEICLDIKARVVPLLGECL